jgi:hypothetical protein
MHEGEVLMERIASIGASPCIYREDNFYCLLLSVCQNRITTVVTAGIKVGVPGVQVVQLMSGVPPPDTFFFAALLSR